MKKFAAATLILIIIFSSLNVYGENTSGIEEVFDTLSGMYIETIDEGLEFVSSVPCGSIVSDAVYFEVPSNISVELTCDGLETPFYNKTLIYTQGYYIMSLKGVNAANETKTAVFTFRISGYPEGRINSGEYTYPKVSCSAVITSDYETGLYKYTLPNYKAFFSSISGYGKSIESAVFVVPGNLGYSFSRDGKTVKLVNNLVYDTPGSYSLKIWGNSYASANGYEASYETVLDFTIPSPAADTLSNYGTSDISSVFGFGDSLLSADTSDEPLNYTQDIQPETDIINDSLAEAYFDTVGIYSETFSSGDAFYTNIPNEGIVGGNVYFDVPYNMAVTMTKDGSLVEFENKTYINDEGSYSLIITDLFDNNKYSARFSFRIQNGMESAESVVESNTELPSFDNQTSEEAEEVEYTISNRYDEEKNMFAFDIGANTFYLSVPDGMFSNYGVMADIPDELEAVVLKNGEEIELSKTIDETGSYELKVSDSVNEVIVHFYISAYGVNYMDAFTAPDGYNIISAKFSEDKSRYSNLSDEEQELYENGLTTINSQQDLVLSRYSMPLDGTYDFILTSSSDMPVLTTTIIVDTLAPEIIFEGLEDNMKTASEEITISCDDPQAVIVLSDGTEDVQQITLSDGKAVISGKGKYTLLVSDFAGNVNKYDFTLGKSGGVSKIFICIVAVILAFIIGFGIALYRNGFLNFSGIKFLNKQKDEKPKKAKKEKKTKKAKKTEPKEDDPYTAAEMSDESSSEEDDWESF